MWNAFVEEGNARHAHDPDLETNKRDIFPLLVEETVSMGFFSSRLGWCCGDILLERPFHCLDADKRCMNKILLICGLIEEIIHA